MTGQVGRNYNDRMGQMRRVGTLFVIGTAAALGLAAASVFPGGSAWAQTAPAAGANAAPGAPASPGPASPGGAAPSSPPAASPSEGQSAYNAGFAALVQGRFEAAITDFDGVAASSSDADQRAAARELARLARQLRQRRIRFVAEDAAPGAAVATAVREIPEDDRPDAGRVELIGSTTLAAFYSGFVLDAIIEVDDFRTGALVVTGTTAAGFVASLLGTSGRTVTGGMADAYTLGLGLGVTNALLLAEPAGADDDKSFLSVGLGGMAVGGGAALLMASQTHPTRGQVSLTGTLSILGISSVGLGLGVADPSDIDSDTVLLLLDGGLDLGAAAGIALAPRIEWSSSRARLVSLSMFLGALAGVSASAIAAGEPDTDRDARIYSGATLAGLWAGFGLGVHFTRHMAPDPRFRTSDALDSVAAIVPTRMPGGGGLAVAGTF